MLAASIGKSMPQGEFMSKLFSLEGHRALVTGSSQGIGFALARGLAEAGAEIVLNGRNVEKLDAAAETLRGEGAAAVSYTHLTLPTIYSV